MDRIFSYFKSKLRSEIALIFLSIMVMTFNALIVFGFWGKAAYETLITLRSIHFVFGFICLVAILKLHHRWTERIAKIIFSLILFPLFFIAWFNHLAMIHSDESWIPFKGFYVIILGLTVVAPAGYLINFFFLLAFFLEIILIWFVLDIPGHSNMILSGEPYYILGTSFICLLLLLSRHQDEKKIKSLAAETAKVEFAKSLARVLLTIRDRMNTPLQNLSLLQHLLKNSRHLPEAKAAALENAITDIIKTNRQFNRLESLVDWQGNNLMSDEEIENWLSELGHKKDILD